VRNSLLSFGIGFRSSKAQKQSYLHFFGANKMQMLCALCIDLLYRCAGKKKAKYKKQLIWQKHASSKLAYQL
jgi:hypothetical protein